MVSTLQCQLIMISVATTVCLTPKNSGALKFGSRMVDLHTVELSSEIPELSGGDAYSHIENGQAGVPRPPRSLANTTVFQGDVKNEETFDALFGELPEGEKLEFDL